ncbi:MAG: 3',5'-cyclic-AMP phosphodiesterase [Gammaproteobacteria bacterium HGW-Gammaproteobacteria-11]|nr:MAG: 3',5'-cyclic-AMP phosphodiesterase [Gammaproteobacteria bacterium HGW-Gammaproteobacteria-11]
MASPQKTESGHIRILQLTDCHLYAQQNTELLGLDTLASLHAVVDQVLEEATAIDLILATGDIAQDASEQGYRHFISAVERLPAPCVWIPGNHDDARLMDYIGAPLGLNQNWIDLGAWRIVMLDSSLPGSVAGFLAQSQLERLSDALANADDRFVLVCLHHHPVAIGCGWMDPLGLLNSPALMPIVATDKRVRALLWGHVHQEFDQQHGPLRLLATPSTCVQFAAHSKEFATDSQAPGYRWLQLFDDGRIETQVKRLPHGRFIPDPDATGY